jgi:hypothetical protein
MDEDDACHGYASSPCMAHEFELCDERGAGGPVNVIFLLIDESREGFRWQVRLHGLADSIEASAAFFPSASCAREAGLRALDSFCNQFASIL